MSQVSPLAATVASNEAPDKAPAPRSGRTAQLVIPGMGALVAQIEPDSGRCFAQGLSPLERQFSLRWLRENMGCTGSRFLLADEISLYNGPNQQGCYIGLDGYVRRRVVGNKNAAVAALRWLRGRGLLHEKRTAKRVSRWLLLPEAAFVYGVQQARCHGADATRARAVRGTNSYPLGVPIRTPNQEPITRTTTTTTPARPAVPAGHGSNGGRDANAGRAAMDAKGIDGWCHERVAAGAPRAAVLEVQQWAHESCQHPTAAVLAKALAKVRKRHADGHAPADGRRWQTSTPPNHCVVCGEITSAAQRRCNGCIEGGRLPLGPTADGHR